MTQTISDDLIQLCREVPLQKVLCMTGSENRQVKILCPFHKERTASCNLFPTGGFKCYGCPAHGNSVDFLMRIGYTFEEAIIELSKYI